MLHVEVGPGERYFLLQRNHLLFREIQRGAQEVRQAQAHFAGALSIDGRKRADGIEAVEEEVRVDLRLQGFQFRLSCQDASLLLASLRLARALEREQDIVQRHREEI